MRECKYCKTKFIPTRKGAYYCSDACPPAYARMVYRNEKEGVFNEVDKRGNLKPILEKNCKQCGDLFKTQTRVNYCHEGCTSKRIKNRVIDKNQITIKELKPLTMEDFFATKEAVKKEEPKRNKYHAAADELERRVFDLLLKNFPDVSLEANFASNPSKSTNIYKQKTSIPKPDITLYHPNPAVGKVLIDVKFVKGQKFYPKTIRQPQPNNGGGFIETKQDTVHLLESDYNRYKQVKEIVGAKSVWIAFCIKDDVYFAEMEKGGEHWAAKSKYDYFRKACTAYKVQRPGMKGPYKLGK